MTDRTDDVRARRDDAGMPGALGVPAPLRVEQQAGEVARLRDLFMDAPAPMCILEGPLHMFAFANTAYRALAGGRELMGRALLDALPEVRGQGFDALLVQVMSTGESYSGAEVPVQVADAGLQENTTKYFNFIYQPLRSGDGGVKSVLVVGTEVTVQVEARERTLAEAKALRRSEERLRRVVEATGAGMWELDVSSQHVTADAQLRELHGFPSDGPVTLDAAFAAVDSHDRARLQTAVAAALDPNGSHRYHIEYPTNASGQRRWLEARGTAFFDESGAPTHLCGTALDVTARKKAELANEGLLAALAAQPLLQVCVLEGPKHVVKLMNAEYRKNVAGGRDIVGMPVLDAFPELAGQGFDVLMRDVLATGVPYIGREIPTRLDPGTGVVEERFFNFVVQPVRGRHETIDTLLNMSHDVTHFVESRRVLEGSAAREKDRADFERQLIGIVSHDLRNPLSTIGMGVSLLSHNPDLAPSSIKTVLRIQRSVELMVRMVNDLLDFTQARLGGGLPMVLAPMSLHALTRQVVDELQMTFPDRELRLEAEGNGDGVWDRDRLGQAVLNLVTNALKYSPLDAAVRVSARGEIDRVELQVWNAGKPIAPDVLPNMFQPMQRGSAAVDPSGRSVGLGLFIVRHIVDALGGSITVTSSADAGTTFTLSLPRDAGAAH